MDYITNVLKFVIDVICTFLVSEHWHCWFGIVKNPALQVSKAFLGYFWRSAHDVGDLKICKIISQHSPEKYTEKMGECDESFDDWSEDVSSIMMLSPVRESLYGLHCMYVRYDTKWSEIHTLSCEVFRACYVHSKKICSHKPEMSVTITWVCSLLYWNCTQYFWASHMLSLIHIWRCRRRG